MREPGRKVPDSNPPVRGRFSGQGESPPAAARPESTMTTAAGLAKRPGTQRKRARIAGGCRPGQILRAIQEPPCGLPELLRLRPDRRPRPGLDSMAPAAAFGKPARQRSGKTLDLSRVACDDAPIRLRSPDLIPQRLGGSPQRLEVALARMDDRRKAGGGPRDAHRAERQHRAEQQHSTADSPVPDCNVTHVPRLSICDALSTPAQRRRADVTTGRIAAAGRFVDALAGSILV